MGKDVIDWVNLIQDRNQWPTFENKVMNIRVPSNVGKFFSIWATSKEELGSMELVPPGPMYSLYHHASFYWVM
jgi:hypothetical protein